MAYIDVLPLAEMKTYLRIDTGYTADDNEITAMMETAFLFIEKYTNVLVVARAMTYDLKDGCARVYDYPINSLTSPADAEVETRSLYSTYTTSNPDNEVLTLNVGFATASDVPEPLKTVAKKMVATWYEDQDKQENSTLFPMNIMQVLNIYKRFLL